MAIQAQSKALVKEAVVETLLAFGIDVSHPEGVMAFQQDMHFVRAQRLQSRSIQNKAMDGGITVILSALGAAALMGAAQFFQGFRI